jgi:NitT/TauT family transport system ATP-binding protein
MVEVAAVLNVQSVSFAYGSKAIVDSVSLSVAAAESVVLMGPSGSGKSTLFRIIAGLQAPDLGYCEIDGDKVSGVQQKVFLGFQDYDAFPWYTIEENIELARLNSSGINLPIETVDAILTRVGLRENPKSYPSELSGGMRKRLALARCLAARARLIVLDEPFASLDSRSRRDLQRLTRTVVEETDCGLLMCTHDAYEAALVADRVIVCSGRPLAVKGCVVVRRIHGATEAQNLALAEQAAHEISRAIGIAA